MSKSEQALREDSGAMLVLALIIITTVALVTGAVLSHGWTNLRTTVAMREVAGTSYAADAGAQVALNNLRLGAKAPDWTLPTFPGPQAGSSIAEQWKDWVYTNNADGTGCFGATGNTPRNSLTLKNVYPQAGRQLNDTSVYIKCDPVPGTGIFGSGGGVQVQDPSGTFASALTVVGTGSLQGITLKPLGTVGQVPVRGGVGSKSYINITSGALVSDGAVRAEGSCSGVIISTPAAECGLSVGQVAVPPAPPSPLPAVPEYRDPTLVTDCHFPSGYYNNASTLSAAVNVCTTAYFSGDYYFDFLDAKRGVGENIWNIKTTVIGGEPTGLPIPGACRSPIGNVGVSGVRFVFGADSRVTLTNRAHVELCGPSNDGKPPLTLYQQPVTVNGSDVTNDDQTAASVTQGTASRVDPFTLTPAGPWQEAVAAVDGRKLEWAASGTNRQAALDLKNFALLSAIPEGATITKANLRINYSKSSGASTLTAGIAGFGSAKNVPLPDFTTGWASVPLKDELQAARLAGAFTGDNPVFNIRLPNTSAPGTLAIDAVRLDVQYRKPDLNEAQDVTFVGAPTEAAGFKGDFVVQGASYLPKGFINLQPGSPPGVTATNAVAFRWGLVALGIDMQAQPTQAFGIPFVSLPDAGEGLGSRVTIVDLKVFVCVSKDTCSESGDPALIVRAMVTDPPYSAWGSGPPRPRPEWRKIEILSWSEQN